MEIGEKDIKNLVIVVIIALLAILAFMLIKPILTAVIGGLILAYVFTPIYKKIRDSTGYPSISAFFVCIVIILIILIPLWILIPKLIQQFFGIFSVFQAINFQSLVKAIFPSANQEFITQVSLSLTNFISKGSTIVLNSLSDALLDLPSIALQFLVAAFVFFFGLRDGAKLKEFVEGLSPFNKTKEGLFVRQFKDITDSIIYGIIIVGIFQGLCAGFGFWIFRVPHALVLTLAAVIASVIPLLGPSIVWIPVNIYLFATASPALAIVYLVYNLVIVSTIDNILRSYIVARKSAISSAIVIIGIIGGALVFGLIGLVIGPLILSYLITLLRAYKEKRIYNLFYEES